MVFREEIDHRSLIMESYEGLWAYAAGKSMFQGAQAFTLITNAVIRGAKSRILGRYYKGTPKQDCKLLGNGADVSRNQMDVSRRRKPHRGFADKSRTSNSGLMYHSKPCRRRMEETTVPSTLIVWQHIGAKLMRYLQGAALNGINPKVTLQLLWLWRTFPHPLAAVLVLQPSRISGSPSVQLSQPPTPPLPTS